MKKNQYIRNLFGVIVLVIGFSACETIIDLEVPNSDPKLVVESSISSDTNYWHVKLSWTQQFFDQSEKNNIGNAFVTISSSSGVIDTLDHQDTGFYKSRSMRFCVPGESYTLNIDLDGKNYQASERCKPQLPIDFLMAFYLPDRNGFIEPGYYVFQKAGEIETQGDYYRWKIYRNDTLKEDFGYILDEDEFRETSYFNINIDPDDPLKDMDRNILPRPFPFRFEVGDTVRIQQHNISKAYFDFLNELQTQLSRSGTPFDSPPTNPNFNISGGAIGFFSVTNVTKAQVIVEE